MHRRTVPRLIGNEPFFTFALVLRPDGRPGHCRRLLDSMDRALCWIVVLASPDCTIVQPGCCSACQPPLLRKRGGAVVIPFAMHGAGAAAAAASGRHPRREAQRRGANVHSRHPRSRTTAPSQVHRHHRRGTWRV